MQKNMFKSESDQLHYMIPLMLDLSALSVLVIGDGVVGRRKAEYFADQCREICIINDLPENPDSLIASYDIIIAATASDAVNETVCGIAKTLNKWYNSATGVGNFLIPAAFFADNFTLAVSTEGKAPAAAAFIRTKICESYPSLPQMISLQETLRAELKETVPEQTRRAEILRSVLDDAEVWQALDAGDADKALTLSRRHI